MSAVVLEFQIESKTVSETEVLSAIHDAFENNQVDADCYRPTEGEISLTASFEQKDFNVEKFASSVAAILLTKGEGLIGFEKKPPLMPESTARIIIN